MSTFINHIYRSCFESSFTYDREKKSSWSILPHGSRTKERNLADLFLVHSVYLTHIALILLEGLKVKRKDSLMSPLPFRDLLLSTFTLYLWIRSHIFSVAEHIIPLIKVSPCSLWRAGAESFKLQCSSEEFRKSTIGLINLLWREEI